MVARGGLVGYTFEKGREKGGNGLTARRRSGSVSTNSVSRT